jgi:hypothetical protein
MANGTADGVLDLAVFGKQGGDAPRVARGDRCEIGLKRVSQPISVGCRLA